jgi:hypothetical protein
MVPKRVRGTRTADRKWDRARGPAKGWQQVSHRDHVEPAGEEGEISLVPAISDQEYVLDRVHTEPTAVAEGLSGTGSRPLSVK